jgi:protein tyrosine/serine phosphatase
MAFHCKSGADRAGLFATLYCIFQLNQPVEEAMKQLSWKYGHFKQAKTGMLDFMFESYLKDTKDAPKSFLDWVDDDYNPQEIKKNFHASSWATFITDKLLRRE